ncbi:hypothetical protein TSOC_014992 [Tetrabaena socialis]|uniref:Uncharacterized protein n=1 Tax=Tetrabaena socialis TaxID=47790 RepID=A0A2J7ZG28_9CHLO|nr:hypothetical protein TSOC_014992 [Tetrabaena socialis]|eukprot:PNG99234.1 hypothetical protein TSOC_014992 [Tetrabaena socialis]
MEDQLKALELLLASGYSMESLYAAGTESSDGVERSDFYQEYSAGDPFNTIAAQLEEQRRAHVEQLAQLEILQRELELHQHQQQLQHQLQGMSGGGHHPFHRSRTTDLSNLGGGHSARHSVSANAPLDDYTAMLQHAAAASYGQQSRQHVQGLVGGQHSLPVRSFSSEHLPAGRRPPQANQPATPPGGQAGAASTSNKKPSGLGPHGRTPQSGRPADGPGGRRTRPAAYAKAPSWASGDWHPMKAVIASGANASTGTGVFLPYRPAAAAAVQAAARLEKAGTEAAGPAQPLQAPAFGSPADRSPVCSRDSNALSYDMASSSTLAGTSSAGGLSGSTFAGGNSGHSSGYLMLSDPMKEVVKLMARQLIAE